MVQFAVADKDARPIRLKLTNLYKTNYAYVSVYNGREVKITDGTLGGEVTLGFQSPQADIYYIAVRPAGGDPVYYDLTVQ